MGFDEIGEMPKVAKVQKQHKLLGELGKTRSAGDVLKTVDRAVFRTFQQQNILKLPRFVADFDCQSSVSVFRFVVQSAF